MTRFASNSSVKGALLLFFLLVFRFPFLLLLLNLENPLKVFIHEIWIFGGSV